MRCVARKPKSFQTSGLPTPESGFGAVPRSVVAAAIAAGHRPRQAAGIDVPRRAAIAKAEQTTIPLFPVRQPDLDVDVRAFGRVQHHLDDRPRRQIS